MPGIGGYSRILWLRESLVQCQDMGKQLVGLGGGFVIVIDPFLENIMLHVPDWYIKCKLFYCRDTDKGRVGVKII